ncbi:unnamed protein product [Thlaspi arvense]|uniref:Uncharacterized protein n=1 Tax=Thlaspi arvense TaxID=13288 RepID=A0AAU9T1N1_THLAR|nr:unnamed protein product [Thlaspi arvense]
MSKLVDRLRARPDRGPAYMEIDSDDDDDFVPNHGRITDRLRVRPDHGPSYMESDSDDVVPMQYRTTEQAKGKGERESESSLTKLDKILDCKMRLTESKEPNPDNVAPKEVSTKQYLVKWKGQSYLHCSWVLEQDLQKAYKSSHHLKTRVNKFHEKMDSIINNGEDFIAIRPEWTTVDRILASRGEEDWKEYLVKYQKLGYDECYWEYESDISKFEKDIQRFKDINSRHRRGKYGDPESNRQGFQQFDQTPEFLTGSLHQYQLEGLNFLRFSWERRTHVILADETGLGKTIQSIAFLASLFQENLAPYLVVAPLSTLQNWESEFATWAPHMNVVVYSGNSQARSVIREHEFYLPKGHKRTSGVGGEMNEDRIKFDVILTSYEMINMDTAFLIPIKWECMIVDEGHRLKNKESKLFSSLQQYRSEHRVLLTGTPLQNNLDELFMLMHFLDAGKFGNLEEFQEQLQHINQKEQISRLQGMLAPHLLRRVKKDVMKDMPPKKELILRIDLSTQQKEIYKAILIRSYKILSKKGAQVKDVLMELKKVCQHPYMVKGQHPAFGDANGAFKYLLESSGKLQLLDKMLVKLKEQGHRVLIYTQFQHMLDLLGYYCGSKNWFYERIDGKVSGAERQLRIDRFNAKNSKRFCFLLLTRAGGLGINLATADTVFIYDSDWNPHADLQAIARAHRLGQKNKVMIYRLVNRGTVEERMVQMSKKKMLLDHVVVGKPKAPNLSQEELDDIIRYGSKDIFTEENEEAGKLGKIHYDDDAIEKLLDRDHVNAEEVSVDDEKEDGFFEVANFEYIDENETAPLEEAQAIENKSSASSSRRSANYWEDLLKDKYEKLQAEELSALGKRKRSGKKIIEEDDLAYLEESSDDETKASDDAKASAQENQMVKRPYNKRTRDNSEPIPLIEGEGQYLQVLGFNSRERELFRRTLMSYAILFLKHIHEDDPEDNAQTFSDGVPKEGLNSVNVYAKLALHIQIKEKLKFVENPLFPDRIIERFPLLRKDLKFWNEEHDKILLAAVSKHGFGNWVSIVKDKEFGMEEFICKELNTPYIIPTTASEQAGLPESSSNQNNASAAGGQENQIDLERELMLKRFVKGRFKILESVIRYEIAEEMDEQNGSYPTCTEQVESETMVMDTVEMSAVEADKNFTDGLPSPTGAEQVESKTTVMDTVEMNVVEADKVFTDGLPSPTRAEQVESETKVMDTVEARVVEADKFFTDGLPSPIHAEQVESETKVVDTVEASVVEADKLFTDGLPSPIGAEEVESETKVMDTVEASVVEADKKITDGLPSMTSAEQVESETTVVDTVEMSVVETDKVFTDGLPSPTCAEQVESKTKVMDTVEARVVEADKFFTDGLPSPIHAEQVESETKLVDTVEASVVEADKFFTDGLSSPTCAEQVENEAKVIDTVEASVVEADKNYTDRLPSPTRAEQVESETKVMDTVEASVVEADKNFINGLPSLTRAEQVGSETKVIDTVEAGVVEADTKISDGLPSPTCAEQVESEAKVVDTVEASVLEPDDDFFDGLPDPLTVEELKAGNWKQRAKLAQLYNELCGNHVGSSRETFEISMNGQPLSPELDTFRIDYDAEMKELEEKAVENVDVKMDEAETDVIVHQEQEPKI